MCKYCKLCANCVDPDQTAPASSFFFKNKTFLDDYVVSSGSIDCRGKYTWIHKNTSKYM